MHGPLFSLLVHVVAGMAGQSEWALRLPAAVAGIATVPALAWLADRWLGRDAAIAVAWLAAGSPFLVWYSQEARNYSLLMLCVCMSGAVLLALARRPAARGTLGYVAVAFAGLLSNLSFVFVLPIHLRWWLGARAGRARRVVLASAAALSLALLTLPWACQATKIWDWRRLHPGHVGETGEALLRGATTSHIGAVPFALHAFAVGYTMGPSLRELRADPSSKTLAHHAPGLIAVAAVFGALGVRGAVALWRRRRLGEALIWLVPAGLIVSWFAASNFKVFHPRYLAVSYPVFLLWVGAGLADLKGWRRGALAAAVGGLWAISLANHYFDPRYGKEDYRGAVRLIEARSAAGEKVLAANTQDLLIYYYHGPLVVEPFWLGYAAHPDRLELKLDQAFTGARGVWVMLARSEELDPGGVFAERLEARYPRAERYRFEGVRLWHVGNGAEGSPDDIGSNEAVSPRR